MKMLERKAAWLVFAVAGLVLMAASPVFANEKKDGERQRTDEALLKRAYHAIQAHDCDTVVKLLGRRLDKPEPIEPEVLSSAAYEVTTGCYAGLGNAKAAYRMALAGTRLSTASDRLWLMRLSIESGTENLAAVVASIESLNQGRGKTLNNLSVQFLGQIEQRLVQRKMKAERRRMLAVLASPSYEPSEPLATADGFRSRYASILMEAGESDKVPAIVSNIQTPAILIRLSLDPRFKAMIPSGFDERAALGVALEDSRKAIRLHDNLLDPVITTAHLLRGLGRPEEALAILQAAKERHDDLSAFADSKSNLMWWWDGLARTYKQLGNYDLMVDALRKGGELKENQGDNVSQVINLAAFQIKFGKATEALKTIADFNLSERPMSAFGTMQMRHARGCASWLAGKGDQGQSDLTYMRDHEGDDPNTLLELTLCMGNIDSAAALLIRLLNDPDRRVDMLLELSDYDDPPHAVPDGPGEKALKALRERADVKAAVAQAGGARRIHLQPEGTW